jgi:hypothetical protein
MRTWFIASAIILISFGTYCAPGGEQAVLGPFTGEVRLSSYRQVYYVSPRRGSDQTGEGSRSRPWQTVDFALTQIPGASSSNRQAVLVSEGVASEGTIQMAEHVDLIGGFSDTHWRRDLRRHRTILSGDGRRRVLTGADHSLLDGFVITGGKVRGRGAGLLCEGVSPRVSNNVFLDNASLGPEPWSPLHLHETAHDGGALYADKGAAPVIENNIFFANETEIGRGAALAFSGECGGRIVRNVFLNNRSGTRDPMRSSDGAAVSIFDRSSPLIQENLFLGNQALANNDGGGLFVALWSGPVISHNLFVGNYADDDGGALFVGGQEHRYDKPLDPLPEASVFFVEISGNVFAGNSNGSRNSGAMRFTMEARGRFSNNISVENTGIFFQRSEVEIVNNTILDDFRFAENKETLGPSLIKDNLIWSSTRLTADVRLEGNNLREPVPGAENGSRQPFFVGDSLRLEVESSSYDGQDFVTRLLLKEKAGGALTGRVVEWAGRYSVIAGSAGREIRVWGDLSGADSLRVLSTHAMVDGAATGNFQGAGQQCRFPWVR